MTRMPLRSPAALATALAVLAMPTAAAAQGDPAFGPLTPSGPLSAPEEPAPQTLPAPEPRMTFVPEPDDQELSLIESLPFAGIAALLLGGVGVAIAREGRRIERTARRERRGPSTRAAFPRSRGVAECRPGTGAKAPPPSPRRRRAKARRRVNANRR